MILASVVIECYDPKTQRHFEKPIDAIRAKDWLTTHLIERDTVDIWKTRSKVILVNAEDNPRGQVQEMRLVATFSDVSAIDSFMEFVRYA